MLSHGMCKGIWKIEKSPCRNGKDSLLLIHGQRRLPPTKINNLVI